MAALECANPNLRRMIIQSSNNCAEMAYEIWQFMNEKGYYQVPTMKQMTTNTMTESYKTAQTSQTATIGQSEQTTPINETTPTTPLFNQHNNNLQ